MTGEVLARVSRLGEQVNGHPKYVADTVPKLLALLERQSDPVVITAIVEVKGTLRKAPFPPGATVTFRPSQ